MCSGPHSGPHRPLPPNQLGSISTRTYRLTSPLQVRTWGNLGTLTSAFPGWQSFWKGSRQAEEKQEAGQVGRPARWGACPLAGVGRGLEADVSSLGKSPLELEGGGAPGWWRPGAGGVVRLQSGARVKRRDSPKEDPNITSRCTGSKDGPAQRGGRRHWRMGSEPGAGAGRLLMKSPQRS